MRFRAILAAALSVTAVSAVSARADIGASGTRLSVAGGAPRFYMTYGHVEEPELYAPVIPELRRLDITFSRQGEDYLIYHKGAKVAQWPIVRSREDVPETGEHPCVLVMGGNVFVPLRQLSELLPVDVKWDKKNSLVSLVPGAERTNPPVASGTRPGAPAITGDTVIRGVELSLGANGAQVRVRTGAAITPNWLTLKNPPRLVLDFPNARWAEGLQSPGPVGDVRLVRLGQFNGNTARLVLELTTPAARITDFRVDADEVVASVGQGRPMARIPAARIAAAPGAPAGDNPVIKAITRRGKNGLMARLPDRSLTSGVLDPSEPSRVPGFPDRPRLGNSLAGRVICVDAGHGGHSSGAKGLNNLEKDLCLKMCLQLQQSLQARGARVIMTRASDEFVSLEGRCDIANNANADLFISIHLNSTPRRNSASGTETYWHTPQSWKLAQALHGRVVGVVAKQDRGIRNRGFYVIRNTNMPSVLLEIAYINNENDEDLLAGEDFHGRLADSLAEGVVDYFNQ